MTGAPDSVPRSTVTSMALPPASTMTPVPPGGNLRPPVAWRTAATGSGINDGSGNPKERAAMDIGARNRSIDPNGTTHEIDSGGCTSRSRACARASDNTGMSNSAGSRSTPPYRNRADNTAVKGDPAYDAGSPAPAASAAAPAHAPCPSKHTAAGNDGAPSKSTVCDPPCPPRMRAVTVVAPMSRASLRAMALLPRVHVA